MMRFEADWTNKGICNFASEKAPLAGSANDEGFTLPPLPYAYNALEPHINEQTLKLHHDKHHAAYVTNLNAAFKRLADAKTPAETLAASRDIAFNGSGHMLHTLYWENMRPDGGDKPTGNLLKMIERDYKSFDEFKKLFATCAGAVQGNGWGVISYEPMGGCLVIQPIHNHQDTCFVGGVPILVMDVWEHAYYLQYQNDRAKYIQTFLDKLVCWKTAGRRLEQAVAIAEKAEMAGSKR